MQQQSDETAISVIEERAETTVRRQEVNGVLYFSVVDVIGLLTDSPIPRNYWSLLKRRLDEEGSSETHTKCMQLKMMAADGKLRKTDAADIETMLRIIQSVPSPKAEPIKQWLAKAGAREIAQATRVPERVTLTMPEMSAPLRDWASYYQAMAAIYEHAAITEATVVDHEMQLGELQGRVGKLEDSLQFMIGHAPLSPEHQATIKNLAKRLHDQSGIGYQTVYWELNQHFHVGKVEQITADAWPDVVAWFKNRMKDEPDLWG
jgi:hypothetical protein